MGYVITCNETGANTGLPKCRGNYGRIQAFIFVPPTAEVDTEANALLEATWLTNIESDESVRWYPWPKFFRYEPSREDHIYTVGDFNDKYSAKDGDADGVASYLNIPTCFAKKIREFNNQQWKAYAITDKGYIRGWSTDSVIFKPFSVFLHVEADIEPTGEEGRLTPVRIYMNEAFEWNEYGIAIYPPGETSSWDPRLLSGLLDATVEVVGVPTGTELVVDVETECDDTPVTGLVVADFLLKDDTPTVETIVSATESTSIAGRYTLDVTTILTDTYTINLKEPSDMTTNGYQAGTAASFSIT